MNHDGTMRALNRYDEYGAPQTGNVGRFQFTGQAWIPELAMSYYKARIYSTVLGRFLQVDPVGYSAASAPPNSATGVLNGEMTPRGEGS